MPHDRRLVERGPPLEGTEVTEYEPGEVYRVTSFHVTDGDTIRAHLADESIVAEDHGRVRPGWDMSVEARFWTRRDLPGVLGKYGPPIRLVTLNTPEIGKAGHDEAQAMLQGWLDSYQDEGLMAEVWPDGGAFGRYLGDVYVVGHRENTASQYMLRHGWLPYLGARNEDRGTSVLRPGSPGGSAGVFVNITPPQVGGDTWLQERRLRQMGNREGWDQ